MNTPDERPFHLAPPTPSDLGDREVPRDGDRLDGVEVALLVTGGIAAFRAPILARALRRQGAIVTAFASPEALRYVTAEALEWSTTNPVVQELTPKAEHLSDECHFDVYLVAPATYNTIGKMAAGIADGAITATLASALGRLEAGRASILIAPTMHGSMHTSILERNLGTLASLGVVVIPPRDAYGKHNLPEEALIVEAVCRSVAARAPGAARRAPTRPTDGTTS